MLTLYNGSKYSWSLFLGHLVIEKLIKGIYAKINTQQPHAPKTHNLLELANKCNLTLTQEQQDLMSLFTRFHLEARYEDYKKEFYDLCTKEYTDERIKNIEEMRTWLKEQLT
jgi:HEPN domain-containing protein